MSDISETIPNLPPSNPNKTVDVDGYRASFYPGLVKRLAVRTTKGEVDLYRQNEKEPFVLPPGRTKPWPASTLEFVRPDGRRLLLQFDDPHRQIDRVEVHLKAPSTGREDGGVVAYSDPLPRPPGDDGKIVLVLEDQAVLCPPVCPDPH